MSITFAPINIAEDGTEYIGELCDCRDKLGLEHRALCEDFDFYRHCDHLEDMCQHNLHDVNLANATAWRLLRAVGVDPDYGGRIKASDLLGRILLAQQVGPASGLDVADPASRGLVAALTAGGACFVDGSPSLEEILGGRADRLADLCRFAMKGTGWVGWS